MNAANSRQGRFKYFKTKKTNGGVAFKKQSIWSTPIRLSKVSKTLYGEYTGKSSMVETTYSKTQEDKSIFERNELISNAKTEKRKSVLVDLSTPRAIRGLLQTQNRLIKSSNGKSCKSYYQMTTSAKGISDNIKIHDKSPIKLSYRNALPDKLAAVSLRRESGIVRSIKPKSMTSKKVTWGNNHLKREKSNSYNYAKIKGNKENTSSVKSYKKSTISLSQNHGFAVKTMGGLSSNKKLGGTKNIGIDLK